MAIFNGRKLSVEIYGESHSEKIGIKVKGFPEFAFDSEVLSQFMDRRKASSAVYSTKRREPDLPEFLGVIDNKISGDFEGVIFNKDTKSKDYDQLLGKPRPSHADYAWHSKDGVTSFTGGGRFSGRLTAPLCILGGIAKQYLENMGIKISAYVQSIGKVFGRSYKDGGVTATVASELIKDGFPSLDKKAEMLEIIDGAFKSQDSVGGRIECVVSGMPCGIGDNLFEGLEGAISNLIFAIPAVKGVEFGKGFDIANGFGSEMNDQMYFDRDKKVAFYSNNAGGINGGISNGNDVTIGVAFRPTPSISREQKTVDLIRGENTVITIQGRHDACIVPRAVPCVESAVAIALLDQII